MIIDFVPSRAAMVGYINEHYPNLFEPAFIYDSDDKICRLWKECARRNAGGWTLTNWIIKEPE